MTRHISFLLSFLPHRIKRLDLKMPFQLQQFVRHATTTVRVSLLAPGMKLVNKSRLLLINTGSTSAIYLLGDICRQKLEKKEQLDWARCTRMALLGFVNGPFSHFWYVLLDKRITGSVLASILKKVLADQTVMAPLSIVLFYIGMGLLERKTLNESSLELKEKFWDTYKADWMLWPAAQCINFFVIPGHLRVTYVNVVLLGWTIYLSYMKNKASLGFQKSLAND